MRGKTYDEIVVGEKASFSKTVTEADIHSFSAVTADFNPIHVDEVYATTSSLGKKMGGRIAQGMLSASLFSTLVGMYIPGKGALYVSQSCYFKRPVKIGDTLRAECEVMEKMEKNRIRMATRCINQNGDIVVEGEAIAIAAKHVEDTL
ncbi:MAG: MaoC family dehydratase [Desulfovibrio sp.]|jgi:3-hydroxybutyryl-CoA dehydratase|nr:MaoC family dehydratase [Desulfovibrio sp.]